MAVVTTKSPAETEKEAREQRQADAMARLTDARAQKSPIINDHQNCYFYAAPRRIRAQSSQGQSSTVPGDDRQLQTSFGFEVTDDFMAMLIDTFMPREGAWAERAAPTNPDEDGQEDDQVVEINRLIKAEDKKIFDQIRSSNFYAEIAKTGVPDASIGVLALLITDPGRGQPFQCLGVPIRELDMDLGPDGRIDFRSITHQTKYRHLPAVLTKEVLAKLPDDEAKKVKDEGDTKVEVVWAWWRNWENYARTEWRHVILLGGKMIHEAQIFGDGAIALVVGRFGATPDFAWPDGPFIKALADMVQLDEVRGAFIENVDFTMRPPKAYEDDGQITIPDEGLRPGDLLPKRPSGGKPAFEDIYEPRPLQAALFETDNLQSRIKRLHYIDVPEQKGKTPPTATQWVDELVIRQRRIGTPGFAFWREFPFEVFQRFQYLCEKRGLARSTKTIIKSVKGAKVPANIALNPYNPAERAQDSQEIATALRFAQAGQVVAPTMWQVVVDEQRSLKNLKGKFRDEIIVFRPDADVAERIKVLSQLGAGLAGGQQGGGAPPAPTGQ